MCPRTVTSARNLQGQWSSVSEFQEEKPQYVPLHVVIEINKEMLCMIITIFAFFFFGLHQFKRLTNTNPGCGY